MRCDEVRAILAQSTYSPAEANPSVADHLTGCADCRAYRAQAQQLDRLLNLDEAVEPRPGFDTRFFARLDELKATGQPARWWRRWPVWVAAASLSMSAAAAVMLLGSSVPPPSLENDMALAIDLEMLEELDLVRQLDAVEAYEVLAELDVEELDNLVSEGRPQ